MSDILINSISSIADRATRGLRKPLESYRDGQQVNARAAVTQYNTSRENQAAIDRLTALLTSDAPPRRDVPAGFYISIDV